MQCYQQGIYALLISTIALLSTPAFSQPGPGSQPTAAQAANTSKLSEKIVIKLEQLHKAANEGDESAQIELGLLYANGIEISRDYEKAVYWLLKAAEQYKKAPGGCSEHAAVIDLMVMVDKKVLPPHLHSEVTAWLKTLGNKLPKFSFPQPPR